MLRPEVVRLLDPARGGCIVDCTVGLGGHAAAILESSPAVTLLGLDRDARALEIATENLARFGDRARLARARFDELERAMAEHGIERASGVLADLGVSSMQLEVAERGFSFMLDGPLDMRMGAGELTAAVVVNRYSEAALTKIFRQYGEERYARRIARRITEKRADAPIETTGELSRLVEWYKLTAGSRG